MDEAKSGSARHSFLTGLMIRGNCTMKSVLCQTTALLLFAIAGPNLVNAQTLMDYVISRETFQQADCAPSPAAGCAAPVEYGWQTTPGCAVPAPATCDQGWQTTVACPVPAASCVTELPSSCAVPPACRPCSMPTDVCSVTTPSCAIPSTPCRSTYAPGACQCQRPGCGHGHGSLCHGGSKRGCGCCSGWCRAHTTGDLYPHFPYQPEYGGYYYFRPYNWEMVLEQAPVAAQWGLHTGNPYSVSLFDAIYEDFEQRYPQGVSIPEPPLRHERPLPNLEDLVRPLP